MVKQADPSTLVNEFADHVAKQTEAISNGDHRSGNAYAKRYIATFGKLRSMGDIGRDALPVLLTHERPDVRVTAAAYLLRHRTAEALAVLREVAKGTGMIAFEASQAIKRWEEGSWMLDPLDGKDAASGDS